MKIKADFVTNSSSSSFVLSIEHSEFNGLDNFLRELNEHPDAYDGAGINEEFSTIDDLKTYVNGEPMDWVKQIVGPEFLNMDKEEYEKCKKSIEEENIIVMISIDNNITELFETSEWYSKVIIDY